MNRAATRKTLQAATLTLAGLATANAATEERYLVRYDFGQKDAVVAGLPAAAVVHHEFDHIGVMAVTMPQAAATALAGLSAVTDVSVDPVHHPLGQDIPYGIHMVRALEQWDADADGTVDAGAATGAGIRLCVVDTGIYASHEDLGGGGVNILGGRSWVNEPWDGDLQGHGTHVAGTIAAMNNDRGVVGVSPGSVDLIIADVFNDAGEGQASSTILAAAEWCADQGANIISMSLGGPVGLLADGYQAIYDRGILIVAAAGNDGLPQDNYPASYPASVSVAAIDSNEVVAEFSNFPPNPFGPEVAAPGVAVLSTYPFENSLSVSAGPSYKANAIANSSEAGLYSAPLVRARGDGLCTAADAPAAGEYANAIVLCERGAVSFREKVDHAAAGGAIGAIIYNDEARGPGNFNGTYGDPCCGPIPAISLSRTDGLDALNYLGQSVTMVVELESEQGYAEVSGTSMATPHASGVAAVHWSACPDLTNDQIRAHLSATTRDAAGDLTPGLRDPQYGYGVVLVKDGVDALYDGIDEYNALIGNPTGNLPANVECPVPLETGAKISGGGWLAGHPGGDDGDGDGDQDDGMNFSMNVEQTDQGPAGHLRLHDDDREVRIRMRQFDDFRELGSACGPVPAGANAVEIQGSGTFNGRNARFRACAADNGNSGRGRDLLYVECIDGCSYDTTTAGSDGVLRGGNIKIKREGESAAQGSSGPSTMALGPLTVNDATAGAMQVLTVEVLDDAHRPVAGTVVELKAMQLDGTLMTPYQAVTGADGRAVFTVVLPDNDVEYRATAGSAESNKASIRPRR